MGTVIIGEENTPNNIVLSRPGLPGPPGPPGPIGPTGQGPGSKWLSSSGPPASGFGTLGDWCLDTTNSNAYEKTTATVWTLRTNLRGLIGPAGPAGSPGSAGPAGPAGVSTVWLQGTTAPAAALGNVNDWYFDTSAANAYQKTAPTTWTLRVNLRGAPGATGPQGLPGQQGPAGAGFVYRGEWQPTTQYAVNDIVSANGSTFRVAVAHTSGSIAPTALTPGQNFNVWAARGEAGASGPGGGTASNGVIWVTSLEQADTLPADTLAIVVLPEGDTTPPAVPTGFTVINGQNAKATLSWAKVADAVDYLVVQDDGAPFAVGNVSTYEAVNLTNGQPYTFTVQAVDAAGNASAETNPVTVTPVSSAQTGQYFTNFSEYTVGAPPANWSAVWDTNGRTYNIIQDAETGNKLLRMTAGNGGTNRSAFVWLDTPVTNVQHILMRVRFGSTGDGGACVRVSGTGTTETGVVAREGVGTTLNHNITGYTSGTARSGGDIPSTITRDGVNFHWIRCIVDVSGIVRYKIWPGQLIDEPTAWALEFIDPSPNVAGRAGVYRSGSTGNFDVDYYALGVDGAIPPVPA